ncbi:hypothetical protein RB213_013719 [Colletotrichum asianum]
MFARRTEAMCELCAMKCSRYGKVDCTERHFRVSSHFCEDKLHVRGE